MEINSPQKMFDFGKEIAQKHKKVLLYGELGAGKTHFCKGFASYLGINPDEVKSPTYTYINIYENKFLHIDLYRLNCESEFINKGIFDMINEYEYICIERPKWENSYKDSEWISLEIKKISPQNREILFI